MARLAKSLVTLRDQVNKAYPDRSKTSDGWIGDPAHASRPSDHNPNADGVVCAFDLTHDPDHGCDAHAIAEIQRQNPHPNLKYIVSNKRITSRIHGWVWRAYSGSNPHSKHVHFSVGVGSDGKSKQPYDDTTLWDIGGGSTPIPLPGIKGVKVTNSKVFSNVQANKLDGQGNGYTDVPHGEGKDPLYAIAVIENGFNGSYPVHRPLTYCSSLDNNKVRVTIIGGAPEGKYTFDLRCDW